MQIENNSHQNNESLEILDFSKCTDEEIVKKVVSAYDKLSNLEWKNHKDNYKDKEVEKLKEIANSYSFIVSRYEAKLSRYVKKFIYDNTEANDMLQDIFVKAFKNLNSFDNSYKFNSWIYRIAHNECINYLKKNKKEGISFIDFDLILPTLFAKEEADDKSKFLENKSNIEKVLKDLDIKYREIIVLNFFEDLSYEEISDILKIPKSTVGVRIKRAKEKIKVLMEKDGYKYEG